MVLSSTNSNGDDIGPMSAVRARPIASAPGSDDSSPPTVRLEFGSAFDMLDFVQVVSDYVGRLAGLDEDQLYGVSVAVRESVVNAIKHGNKNDLEQARHRRVRRWSRATT